MKTYTTIQGDMWDQIAIKTMGSAEAVGELMMHNRAYLDLYTFPAGVVLEVPEVTRLPSETVPPWKRGVG